MTIPRSNYCRQRGLTLVELMLALLLGVVLSFGVTQLFLAIKTSYLRDEEMARLQENGRFALRYLARELGLAGYLANVFWAGRIHAAPAGTDCFEHLLDTRMPIEHYNDISRNGVGGSIAPTLPEACLSKGIYVEGSDLLLVRRTLDTPSVVGGEVLALRDPNSVYLRVETYPARAALEKGGGTAAALADSWEYFPQLLFLRSYSMSRSDGVPTLCRVRLAPRANRLAPTECLVEGVEDLQFEFGIDEDGDQQADRFDPAPDPEDLRMAVAARVYLLVRSVHQIPGYSNKQSYALGSKRIGPAHDAYYRRVMQTTVLLRNSTVYKS